MKIRDLLAEAEQRLGVAGVETPRADVEWLLANLLNVDRMKLSLLDDIDENARAAFEQALLRRIAREPLQHIIGTAAFRTVELKVGPGVFVPRPETELLAGWAIDHAKELQSPIVVDLGTGSGAIAKAMETEAPHARVFAIEVDPAAFAYAEHNLRETELVLGDLADAFPELNGTVDIVVSNPPYIPLDAWESVTVEARDFDPHLALFSGEDGLDAIRAIERTASRLLTTGGVLGFEHADVQGESAPAVLAGTGRWHHVRDHRDLANRPRFTTAQRTH